MYYAGIDVGGTSVKLGIFDDAGEMCKSGAVATVREDPYALAQRIAQGLRAMELPFETAGVCTAGCVNLETGLVQASNLGWQDVPLAQILQDALGCPVAIDNDAAGALMGEWKRGACRNEQNILYLTLGTGVGGAFVVNGKPLRGHDNMGGEVGHIITHADGLPCPCGAHGCFEQYASATALMRMAGGLDGAQVFARAAQGDAEMNRVLDAYAHELAIGIVSMVELLRFEVVVLGGGVSQAGEALLSRVRKEMQRVRSDPSTEGKPRLMTASLGNAAGIVGAGMMAIELAHARKA